ncbi:MFS transporter [Alicyclobacillus sp. ALC3]|uniref:MFS transporter n=1 Tax=Alicyclobacillus sp. ALC3 TaxID=2796143 RepID=UPI00237811FE|nr:MFS transporter [Alicyclobacillus sp. ALC3]
MASVALFVGVAVAMIISPILMHHGGLGAVELGEGIPAVVVMLWVMLGLVGPLRAPLAALPAHGADRHGGTTSAQVRSVRMSLQTVFADRFIWMMCGLLAVGLGVFDALNTWLQPIFSEYGMGGASGNLLALMLVAGIFGSALLPSIAAKRNLRKTLMVTAVGLTTWMLVAMMLWQSTLWIGLWMVVAGFFLLAGFPIILEWTGRQVAPGLQGIAVGFIMLTSHLGGIVLIFMIQFALKPANLAVALLAVASALGLWLTLRLPGRRVRQTEHEEMST